jgi:hypothetical protein
MKHIYSTAKLSDIDYSSLTQGVNTDFLDAWTDDLHWFSITRFKSALNRTEFEACGTASFIWEVPKIIEARSPTKFSGFMVTIILYKFLYIWQV